MSHIERPGVVTVVGPDALTFLQSLVSQDLQGIAIGEARPSLLLQPQGKLLAAFRVLRTGEESFLLDTEPEIAPVLAAGLNRFKIRVKVDVHDHTGQYVAIRERGGDTLPVDLIVHTSEMLPNVDAPAVDDDTWERYRIERGEPRQPLDIDDKTIAQEAFLEQTHVSFTKGCFIGQELVCRIDSRGHVNRFLRVVQADAGELHPGDELSLDGAVVGTVTSSAKEPDGGAVALAMVRKEVEPGAQLESAHATVKVSA